MRRRSERRAGTAMDLGRSSRGARKWLEQRLRPKILAALGLITILAALLLWQAYGIPQYTENLALNLGADLIGAIVIIFVISPLITRAQHGRVRDRKSTRLNSSHLG